MNDSIRHLVQQHGRLAADTSTLTDESDLYQAGLTSHASVTLMLALEEAFDVEIPDEDAEKIRTVQDAIDYIDKRAKVAK